jgi:precorrin-2/cobalt-factor-2 C20-methyltransferase
MMNRKPKTMTDKTGTFYGIGVGPGDPELIPIKSVRILETVDVVFTAASTKNDFSRAVEIARDYIPTQTPVETLSYPMCTDETLKRDAWAAHAQTIIARLEKGQHVAFLTLGDPLTYSTYGYTLRYVRANRPSVPIKTIPGITSYQAAAASMNLPLVEGNESLLIMSGVEGGDKLKNMPIKPENVVFLKAYRNVKGIRKALEDAGMGHRVGVINCAQPDEEIVTDLHELEQRSPNYWTLVIAKQKKG